MADDLRFAIEEEKRKLINALKASKESQAKEYLKRFFGTEKKKNRFKFKQSVLVRLDKKDEWKPAEYGYLSERYRHITIGGLGWKHCIPYSEQTEHLLGTIKNLGFENE